MWINGIQHVRNPAYSGFAVWEPVAPTQTVEVTGRTEVNGLDVRSRTQLDGQVAGSINWSVLQQAVDDTVDSYIAEDNVVLHYKGAQYPLRGVYRVVERETTDGGGNSIINYERILSVQSRFVPRKVKDRGVIERLDRDGVTPRVQFNKVIGADNSHQGRTMLLLRELKDYRVHTAAPPRYTAERQTTPYQRYSP